MPLSRLLDQLSRSTGVLVVADNTISGELVPEDGRSSAGTDRIGGSRVSDADARDRQVEARITALVKTLPEGTTWVKLYLPVRNKRAGSVAAPNTLPRWQGDDVAAYAFAQAHLLGDISVRVPADSVEILGQQIPKDQAQEVIARLNLRPVYLLTHVGRRGGARVGAEPWSPLSRNEWAQLSPEERKTFGKQQADQIMSLSPEERSRVLEQMKQQDRFFDSIKDPLEKMVGHDL